VLSGLSSVDPAPQASPIAWGDVIQYWQMGHTLTIRLTKELADWLRQVSEATGVPQGKIVRDQLEKARGARARRGYLRLAGAVRGARDLSTRKGFSR
jgi:hypothetical protein